MDVGLPIGMNGWQMAEAGMELRLGLETLFITVYAENAVMGYGRLGRDRCVEAVCGGRGGGRVRELLGR